ncbi:DUF3515 family protein [Microterricola viridarii]|uniref:DUF3515 domain-containing protein n=1 Tax=Microterricola viridarii TaxID=412690 RepID=A0A1H1SQJ3_9MICO|nr:DUF3515 family protein [Microterricola viridarii]SDS50133.1 Protein of unknown function [Microterricola viridarii]
MLSRTLTRPLAALGTALLITATLAGCAAAVALEPADDATNPGCAEIVVRLPEALGEQKLRETNAQGTGAWGDPATILLRCGVEVPGPTTQQCVAVGGIDWIVDDSNKPIFRFVTYGRTPATEVIVDYDKASASALIDLEGAISVIPAENACVDVTDVLPAG